MFAAHMDEIGLIVNHVDENGFVRFTPLGGVFPHTLVGSRVEFLNGVSGLISARFLVRPVKLISSDKMYIDVGATSPKDCPVQVGDVATFTRPYLEMGNRLVAKSMDDRIGVAVLIETMRQLKSSPHEVYFVFTTQEEVGVRGAITSAFGIAPEIGIAIDVTSTDDTPEEDKASVFLGKGPSVKFKDAGSISSPALNAAIIKTAEKNRIPYQREVATMGGTDARVIQIAGAGALTTTVSIPCRHVHSPSEMVDYDDVKNTVKLLVALLEKKINI